MKLVMWAVVGTSENGTQCVGMAEDKNGAPNFMVTFDRETSIKMWKVAMKVNKLGEKIALVRFEGFEEQSHTGGN